jgi:hypothetical protein
LQPIDKNNKRFTMDSNKVPPRDPRKPFFLPKKKGDILFQKGHDALPAPEFFAICERGLCKAALLTELVVKAQDKLNPSGD